MSFLRNMEPFTGLILIHIISAKQTNLAATSAAKQFSNKQKKPLPALPLSELPAVDDDNTPAAGRDVSENETPKLPGKKDDSNKKGGKRQIEQSTVSKPKRRRVQDETPLVHQVSHTLYF